MSKEILKWYKDMGLDDITDNIPNDYTKADVMEQNATGNPVDLSRAIAEKCTTLETLKQALSNFELCDLKKTATNTVFADGNPDSKIMLIGEAPGANEDLYGIPFCGESGKLLDHILKSIGLDRSSVYISNTIFWRPPANRRPTIEEMQICKPFVEKHISLIEPKLLLLVGSTAVSALLDNQEPMSRLRNREFKYDNQYLKSSIATRAIFHPSYLLRQPSQKKLVWNDMLRIKRDFSSLLPIK